MPKIFLPISLLFVLSCVSQNNKKTTMTFHSNPVVAHRGAWKAKNLPENSIASLRQAIELGCTGSEFDVRMTADDSLIINHDPHYNKLEIEKTSFADLSIFKLSNGEKLPTLQDYVLAGIRNNTGTRLVCEIKPSGISKERGQQIAEKVVNLVHRLKAEKMVVYISFDYDILKKIIELNPNAITQYLNGEKSPEVLKSDKITGLDYYFTIFKTHPEWIISAKSQKIQLNAWTVNDPIEMDNLLQKGFDYITTNEPELLFEKLKK